MRRNFCGELTQRCRRLSPVALIESQCALYISSSLMALSILQRSEIPFVRFIHSPSSYGGCACTQVTISAPFNCSSQPRAAARTAAWVHGQPWARANCRTARWPFRAASTHVQPFQGHPLARTHRSTSKWPLAAAASQVCWLHGHPFACAQCSTARWPPLAACALVSLSHGQPLARRNCRQSRCPPPAAAQHALPSQGQQHSCSHLSITSCPSTAALEARRGESGRPHKMDHLSRLKDPKAEHKRVAMRTRPSARMCCITAACNLRHDNAAASSSSSGNAAATSASNSAGKSATQMKPLRQPFRPSARAGPAMCAATRTL